jgi:hypothetical protein
MRIKFYFWILIFLLICGGEFVVWGENGDLLNITNKYVKIFINNTPEETGRFAIDVTTGDPNRDDDNNKPLIYGHPRPWTSYTTLRINNENYVFGKAAPTRRPGRKLPGGKIIDPPQVSDNRITMKCQYGSIVVEQILEITKSPSTGAMDTGRIKYIIHNTGTVAAEAGLRATFDTLVGDNDGAPFRLGQHEITSETAFNREDLPDFWQAFDSLEKPSVIAQGTLKGGDVTTPDRLIFTNWGKAADYPWEIPLERGATFMRTGEDEMDSAVAMIWSPQIIPPGSKRVITMYYGLGGVTFAPGNTFLGISAPADVQYLGDDTRSYTIVMYMEHRGEAKARNVTVNLDLPAGLSLVSGKSQQIIAELDPGVTKQIAWEIKPDGLYCGISSFQIRVTGDGLESNQVTRKINIAGLVSLGGTLILPKLKVVSNQLEPNPIPVKLKLRNLDALMAYDLKAIFKCETGLMIADGDQKIRNLSDLDPGKEAALTWMVTPVSQVSTGVFKIVITGANTMPLEVPGRIAIPVLKPSIGFSNPGFLKPGQVFYLDVNAFNLADTREFSLDIKYDPTQIRMVYISRGTFGVEADGQLGDWSSGTINAKDGKVTMLAGKRRSPLNWMQTTLARLNFVAVGSGEGVVTIEQLILKDAKGNRIPYQITPRKYQITEGKNER